mmetsp:Transcript_39613/g.64918  ORF Transcript_39613/g.64918 Transcript_39613/m.64918 type:complete len:274 (-) Transcript_39613:1679-2500(-)
MCSSPAIRNEGRQPGRNHHQPDGLPRCEPQRHQRRLRGGHCGGQRVQLHLGLHPRLGRAQRLRELQPRPRAVQLHHLPGGRQPVRGDGVQRRAAQPPGRLPLLLPQRERHPLRGGPAREPRVRGHHLPHRQDLHQRHMGHLRHRTPDALLGRGGRPSRRGGVHRHGDGGGLHGGRDLLLPAPVRERLRRGRGGGHGGRRGHRHAHLPLRVQGRGGAADAGRSAPHGVPGGAPGAPFPPVPLLQGQAHRRGRPGVAHAARSANHLLAGPFWPGP